MIDWIDGGGDDGGDVKGKPRVKDDVLTPGFANCGWWYH